jgi:dimethylglycine dehydrogenase
MGYEITVPAAHHRELWLALKAAGSDLGLCPIGDRAIDSLRLEKAYGIWSTEFTQAYTPGMSGLERFIAFDKGDFIGREAALAEREEGPKQRLVLLEVDADHADAMGDEPVWHNAEVVGFVTSGSYGHHVKKSLALAYINSNLASMDPELLVSVIGERRPARVLPEVPYDPSGSHLRG